jgi:hypothetical protein
MCGSLEMAITGTRETKPSLFSFPVGADFAVAFPPGLTSIRRGAACCARSCGVT